MKNCRVHPTHLLISTQVDTNSVVAWEETVEYGVKKNSGGLCMCCCVSSMVSRYIDYTAEAYGLYLALATDSNIPVDFIVSLERCS